MTSRSHYLLAAVLFLAMALLLSSVIGAASPAQAAKLMPRNSFISPVGTWISQVTFYSGLQKGQKSTSHLTFAANGTLTATTDGLLGTAQGIWSVLDPRGSVIDYEFDEPFGNGYFVHVEQRGYLFSRDNMETDGWGTLLQNGVPVIPPGHTIPDAASQSFTMATRVAA